MSHSSKRVFLVLTIALLSAFGRIRPAHAAAAGVVVEEITSGSSGERAGIRVNDLLLAWQRPTDPPANPDTAHGTIESVFDWMWVEMEQGPRGAVNVRGVRDGQEAIFDVAVGNWGIKVRPRFDDEALKSYAAGGAAIGAGELERGTSLWHNAANSFELANEMATACWMALRIGNAWADARRWKEAQSAYQTARLRASRASIAGADAFVWDALGRAFQSDNAFREAEQAYESAKTARERASPEGLGVARSLNNLGRLAWTRGDLPAAAGHFEHALGIQERMAPGSRDMASVLSNLALVVTDRGDLPAAEAYLRRAVAIDEKLAPDSLALSLSLNNLGNVAINRGDVAAAAAYYARALAIQEKLAPGGLDVARSFSNLGLAALTRGDLAAAESHYKRSLAIREKLAPGSVELARILNRLGVLARTRGELEMAESYYTRALAIREKLAPDSLEMSDSLNNLGVVAHIRGDLPSAMSYYTRALTLKERLAPDSLTVADALNNLGELARARGELAAAAAYQQRALAIDEKRAPGSLTLARHANSLGMLALERGDLAAAEASVARALMIREQLAPGSSDEAESLYHLGLIHRKANRAALAAEFFRRGIAALEAQFTKLGGSQEAQSGFGAQFADYYRDLIDLLIEQHQPAEAFHVLERSRARTLLAMLAERDLVFTTDVPDDIERERKRIAWEYDDAQSQLTQLSDVKEQARIDDLLNAMRSLRERQADLVARVRQQSSRFASLQYPQALDQKGVQAALDSGTVLLSYSVSKEKSYLFALTADAGVRAYALGVGETQLREEIERFRSLIQRTHLGPTDVTALVERGRHLYDVLVAPVAQIIGRARRVLIVPDGPLHALPFAALVLDVARRSGAAPRDWMYLVEWKPVHVVVSATVYAELRKGRQHREVAASDKTLVAFGDPKYPSSASADGDEGDLDRQDAVVRSMLTRGYRLAPLPATRREVTAIGGLYRDKADIFLGEAATEERAKGVAKATRYLHFASHGLLDQRFPLNSGLALAIPDEMKEGRENGILQAWEVFERVRIDADLVVLSACETGLGTDMGGEGLVGLTRAFQYAGARSVLASLWSVADGATATLMTRFYGYLKAGQSKDAALRHAQLDLIRGPRVIDGQNGPATTFDASHPFYWAPFQLNGDWR